MLPSSHSPWPPGHHVTLDYNQQFSLPSFLKNFQRRFSSILFNSADTIRKSTSLIGLTYASFGRHLRSLLSPFAWLFPHRPLAPSQTTPRATKNIDKNKNKNLDNLFPADADATVDSRLDGTCTLGTAKPCSTSVNGVQYVHIDSENGTEWVLRDSSCNTFSEFPDFGSCLPYEDMIVDGTSYLAASNFAHNDFSQPGHFGDHHHQQQQHSNQMQPMTNVNGMMIPDGQQRPVQYPGNVFDHGQSQSPPVQPAFISSNRQSSSSQSSLPDGSFYIPELSFTPSSKDGNSPGSYEELLLRDAAKMNNMPYHDVANHQNVAAVSGSYIPQENAERIRSSSSDEGLALSELYSQMFGNDMLDLGATTGYDKFSMPISQAQPAFHQGYDKNANYYMRTNNQTYEASLVQNYNTTPGAMHSDGSGVDSSEEGGISSSMDFPTDSGGSFMSSVSPVTDSHSGDENTMHKCPHCGSVFKVKGYLTRHIKKHALNKAYTCPFFQSDTASSCHKTGGFSRRDTYKIHLKTRHFVYPPNTELKERNNVPGNCGGCGRNFINNEEWITDHIEINRCPGVLRSCTRDRSMHIRRLHMEETDRSRMHSDYQSLPASVAPVPPV